MSPADVKTGKPRADGRYVMFVRCRAAAARDWVEPIIATWHGDRWHTSFIASQNVIGWIGPLPVMKVDEIAAPEVFDL